MTLLPSPKTITETQFRDILSRYVQVVETISQSKAAKLGQRTLLELDEYRYVEAPKVFGLRGSEKKKMELEDVKSLVEWKLRHGKFRPTLMGFVAGNPLDLVRSTVDSAIKAYLGGRSSEALDILKMLKGIGPATASLLLSVHDTEKVPFFSDELYYWLCANGVKSSLKYTSKEYNELASAASEIMKRLGVSALDVERVAYVLMKESDTATAAPTGKKRKAEVIRDTTDEKKSESKLKASAPAPKRPEVAVDQSQLRRSKRGKAE